MGLIRLLSIQLHLDIHQLDEPPLPAAAANILSLHSSLPGTPKSPHGGLMSNGGPFGAVAIPPASPLRRSSSGSSSPRPGSAGPGSRRGVVEPSIPEVKGVVSASAGGGGEASTSCARDLQGHVAGVG
jgi:hypothetical protein